MSDKEVYIIASAVVVIITFLAVAAKIDKVDRRLKEYDKYFQCLGIGMTIDEMQKKGMTKAKAPTCAPGGPEDYIKPPW